MRFLPIVFVLLLVSGCVDSRTRRAANLGYTKVKVSKQEFKDAPTAEAKVKVADEYFETAEPMMKAVADYVNGADPDAKEE